MNSVFSFFKDGRFFLKGDIECLIETVGKANTAKLITNVAKKHGVKNILDNACVTVNYAWQCRIENKERYASAVGLRLCDEYFYWALHSEENGLQNGHVVTVSHMGFVVNRYDPHPTAPARIIDDQNIDNLAELYARHFVISGGDWSAGYDTLDFRSTYTIESELEDLRLAGVE